jgi:hypothetical protein
MLMAVMGWLHATMAMPGIAGILLSLAMAVDANVIILERVREELRKGKDARASIEEGYSKAFTAIFDGHVTAIVAAVCLLQFGTGPVKGFGITLLFGLIISLVTAVWVTHVLYDVWFAVSRWLTGIYVAGVLIMCARLAAGFIRAERLRKLASPVSQGPLVETLQRLSKKWSLHVAPVLAPEVASWPVYLPQSAGGWVDFWTGERHAGGRTHDVASPLERIPLHLRAGSILPLGPVLQSTAEATGEWDMALRRAVQGGRLLMHDVAVHAGGAEETREAWLARLRQFGIPVQHRDFALPQAEVERVARLRED